MIFVALGTSASKSEQLAYMLDVPVLQRTPWVLTWPVPLSRKVSHPLFRNNAGIAVNAGNDQSLITNHTLFLPASNSVPALDYFSAVRSQWLERTFRNDPPGAMETLPRFLENTRILVVDDKADFRLLTARFLTRQGALVFAAKNASEGVRLVQEIRPDVVLSDINMPGRSGVEFLADIRSLGGDSGGSVPVIAMTAYVLDEVVTEAGFQRILRKPFPPDQLLAAIASVL